MLIDIAEGVFVILVRGESDLEVELFILLVGIFPAVTGFRLCRSKIIGKRIVIAVQIGGSGLDVPDLLVGSHIHVGIAGAVRVDACPGVAFKDFFRSTGNHIDGATHGVGAIEY